MEEGWAFENGLSALTFLRPLISASNLDHPKVGIGSDISAIVSDHSSARASFWAISAAFALVGARPFQPPFGVGISQGAFNVATDNPLQRFHVLQAMVSAETAVEGIQLSHDGTWLHDGSFDRSGSPTKPKKDRWLREFYRQIDSDCQRLAAANSDEFDLFGSMPLWLGAEPDWFILPRERTRAIWAKDPDTWAFWLRWWDGVIVGKPLPMDLQRDVALIEDEIWQQGPQAVAVAIAAIEEKYATQDEPDYRVSPKTQINAEVLVRAAIADFTFDEIRHLMRMVPFPEDIDLLKDAVLLEKFLRDAKGVSRSNETMKAAFLAEGRAMQGAGGLATYLDAVLEEFSAARQLGELNVGWVIECGDILQGYSLSAELNAEIGQLGVPLKASVQKLLELTRTYFASTLLRFAPLKDIRSHEETSLFALMEDLRRGLKVISSQSDDSRIGVAPEAIAVFEKLMFSIDRIIQAEFLATDPARKTILRRDVDFMIAQVAVSMMLSWESGKRVAKGGYKVLGAASVTDEGPGALESLVGKFLDLIGK